MDLDVFIEGEALKIIKKYKISRKEAEVFLRSKLEGSSLLSEAIKGSTELKDIYRLREYKVFIKTVKKDIYYHLRRYLVSEAAEENTLGYEEKELSQTHISSREREPYLKEFNKQVLAYCGAVKNIIDIGGGVFPVTFPFRKFKNLENYVWVDKDKRAYKHLKELSKNLVLPGQKLILFNESIGDRPWEEFLPKNVKEFDLGLMIKLIGVVWRQERELLDFLIDVPAKKILVTAPKEAMTKKEDIRRREDWVLHRYIEQGGFRITGKINVENEFGYFLERN
jgi:hypothetical protein